MISRFLLLLFIHTFAFGANDLNSDIDIVDKRYRTPVAKHDYTQLCLKTWMFPKIEYSSFAALPESVKVKLEKTLGSDDFEFAILWEDTILGKSDSGFLLIYSYDVSDGKYYHAYEIQSISEMTRQRRMGFYYVLSLPELWNLVKDRPELPNNTIKVRNALLDYDDKIGMCVWRIYVEKKCITRKIELLMFDAKTGELLDQK